MKTRFRVLFEVRHQLRRKVFYSRFIFLKPHQFLIEFYPSAFYYLYNGNFNKKEHYKVDIKCMEQNKKTNQKLWRKRVRKQYKIKDIVLEYNEIMLKRLVCCDVQKQNLGWCLYYT